VNALDLLIVLNLIKLCVIISFCYKTLMEKVVYMQYISVHTNFIEYILCLLNVSILTLTFIDHVLVHVCGVRLSLNCGH
jgi:uncharacterized membrane protein YecN with MAPEG domain